MIRRRQAGVICQFMLFACYINWCPGFECDFVCAAPALVSRLQNFGSSSPPDCHSISGGISMVLYFPMNSSTVFFKVFKQWVGDKGNLGETLTQSSWEIRLPSFRARQWRGLIAVGWESSSDQRQRQKKKYGGCDWNWSEEEISHKIVSMLVCFSFWGAQIRQIEGWD